MWEGFMVDAKSMRVNNIEWIIQEVFVRRIIHKDGVGK
jgi:hypothetical protein